MQSARLPLAGTAQRERRRLRVATERIKSHLFKCPETHLVTVTVVLKTETWDVNIWLILETPTRAHFGAI